MKKVILLGLILLLMTGTSAAFAAPSTYRVLVNGYVVTGDTLTQSNTTLVPFKVIFQELAYKISYTAKTKTIKADKKGISISLTVGSTKALVNGKETKLPVAPKIVNGVTYVPLRFIANVSGEKVSLDSERKVIQIGKQIDWALLDLPSFRNAKWGMSVDQVKKTEKSSFQFRSDTKVPYLTFQTKVADFKATAVYFFPDEMLKSAGYLVELSGVDKYIQDYKALVAYLTKQYGEPTVETIKHYHDVEGIDYTDEEWNQLILSGELGLVANWRSIDSEIMLVVAYNLQEFSDIQITYTSWWGPIK